MGMAVALRLAGSGRDVTLYESAGALGGLAAPWEIGGIVWDRHYHVILESDSNLLALLRELQLERQLHWRDASSAFFVNGEMHPFTSARDFVAFPVLRIYDKIRLVLTILRALFERQPANLENRSAESWLRQLSGSRVFELLWRPLMRAKFGDAYKETSAAFMRATIVRLYGGLGRSAGTRFGYISGGYRTIVARLAKQLENAQVGVRTSAKVDSIDALEDGSLALLVDGQRTVYDCVVVTTPAPVAARLCTGLQDTERARLRAIRHQGIICASVLLNESLGSAYITNIADESVPFTAVIEMTSLVDPSEIGGSSLVYLPLYVDPESPYFAWSDDEIRESFITALERMYPNFRRSTVVSFRVSRVPYVFALPVLGYSKLVPSMRTSVPGLFIANSTHIADGTLNVNETLGVARRAYEAIR